MAIQGSHEDFAFFLLKYTFFFFLSNVYLILELLLKRKWFEHRKQYVGRDFFVLFSHGYLESSRILYYYHYILLFCLLVSQDNMFNCLSVFRSHLDNTLKYIH